MMWELLNQIIWIPIDIMQRISHRVLLLGRAMYGGIFGLQSKPAIKEASPTPPPQPFNNQCQFRAISISPVKEVPMTHIVNMDYEEKTSEDKTLLSLSSSTSEKSPTRLPTHGVTLSGTIDVTNPSDSEVCSVTMCEVEESSHASSAYTANDELPEVVVEKRGPRGNRNNAAELCKNVADGCTPADETIRNRLSEKRRKFGNKFDESADMIANLQVKKPKLSVEAETDSNSLCQELLVRKNKKKRSKKTKKVEVEKNDNNMGQIRAPPNYFIAIQVSDKDIVNNVAQLQRSMAGKVLSPIWHGLENTAIFKDAMVPVTKLHFTLHVMHLKEGDVEKAQAALQECCSKVHQEFIHNPLEITINGLGHFRNNVIFAQIKEKDAIERLTQLSDLFRAKFNELKIPVDPRPFNPHMTIAKISRSNKLYRRKIRSFPPDIMSNCGQSDFGIQRVTSVQLLQMAGEDKATGYYHCHGEYFFKETVK